MYEGLQKKEFTWPPCTQHSHILCLLFALTIVKTFLRLRRTQHRRFEIIIVRLPLRGIIIHQYYHEGK